MNTDNIRTIIFRSMALLCMLSSIASCTLYMDDEPLREDLMGFDDVAKETTEFGEVEYQYNDSVYSIASNVLEYVQRIENDSIIYYLESTPEEFIPKPGYYLSAHCSRKIPFGLNSQVLKVERTGGMIKVTTTHASMERVYKHLKADYNIPITFRSVTAKDSLQMKELGMDTTNLAVTDWTILDKATKDADEDKAEAKTRSDDSDPWFTIIDAGFEDDGSEDGAINLYFDSDSGSGILSGDLVKIIETIIKLEEGADYFKNVHVKGGAIINLHTTMHVSMVLDPVLITTIDLHMAPTMDVILEMGFGSAPGADLMKSIHLFRKNRCKDLLKKAKMKLPEIRFPIPYISPAATGVIKPNLTFGFSVWGIGSMKKRFYLDEIKAHIQFVNQFLNFSGSTVDKQPSKIQSRNAVFSGMLSSQLSLTGGIGIGIRTAGDVVSILLNNDLQNTLSASVEESTPSLLYMNNYSAYSPDNNRFAYNMDYVLGVEGIFKLFTGWDFLPTDSYELPVQKEILKDFSISHEMFRGKILEEYAYIRPGVGDFSVVSKQYNPEDEKLKSFTVRLDIRDNGLNDNYRLRGAKPFIALKGMTKNQIKYFDKDSKGNTYSGIEKKNYEFYVEPDKWTLDPNGYTIVPCIRTVDGDTVQINGWDIPLPADLKMVTFLQPDFTQSYGLRINEFDDAVKRLTIKNKYKSNSAFAANPDKFSYYEFMSSHKIAGAANVQKWGLDVKIKDNISGATMTKEIVIEDRAKKAFKSGVKNVLLSFISDADPAKSKNPDGPFTVTIEPFYYTTTSVKKKVSTGVVTTQTLTYGIQWSDAFTDMDFTSVGM